MAEESALSPKCQALLDRFITVANKRNPYPENWELFFDFVHVCHDENSELKPPDLYPILTRAGFPQGPASQLTFFYKQGRSLLDRPEGYDQI